MMSKAEFKAKKAEFKVQKDRLKAELKALELYWNLTFCKVKFACAINKAKFYLVINFR